MLSGFRPDIVIYNDAAAMLPNNVFTAQTVDIREDGFAYVTGVVPPGEVLEMLKAGIPDWRLMPRAANQPLRPIAGRPTAPPITTPLIDQDALSAEVRKRHEEHGCDFPKRTRGDRGKRWTCPTCKREWLPTGSPAPLKGRLPAAWADMTTLCRFDLGATSCNLPKGHDGRHDPAPVHDPSDHDPDWAIHRDES
jgi:hypothetical protein